MALDFAQMASLGDTGVDTSWTLGADTVPAEVPTDNAGGVYGSTSQPLVASAPQVDGFNLQSGLNAVNATVSSLASAWNSVQGTVTAAVNTNNGLTAQQIASNRNTNIAQLQAQAQIDAARKAASASNTGLSGISWPVIFGAVALLFTVMNYKKG